MNYFNDNEPYVAEWLRNLYPKDDVDQRSVLGVTPENLTGYMRCHFFAGIGGWEYALNLADWPANVPVWTASLPCQPFSTAGLRKGEDDERHLWPVFRRLVAECLPPVIFGEQVASKDGRVWLSRVRADLEALGYGVGASDLCAAGIGAPHIRQRLYWVAARVRGLADSADHRRSERWDRPCIAVQGNGTERAGEYPESGHEGVLPGRPEGLGHVAIGLADGDSERGCSRPAGSEHAIDAYTASEAHSAWRRFEVLPGLDGKVRRIKPGVCVVAHGVSRRGAAIKALGNSIVPPLAAEFIAAFMDVAGLAP